MLNGKLPKGRGIAAIVGIFLPAFYIYAITLGKDGGGGLKSEMEVYAIYLFGGLFAFDKLTYSLIQFDYGANLFRVLYAVAHVFDSSIPVLPLMEDYQYFGAATNVYTIFGRAFRDFGYIGVAIYMFFLGVFHGHLYRGVRHGSIYYKLFFAWSFFALITQFFNDHYMALASAWIQLFMLILVFRWVTARGRLIRSYERPLLGKKGGPRLSSAQ
jgi:oligosaccharide repeat unit polymerase